MDGWARGRFVAGDLEGPAAIDFAEAIAYSAGFGVSAQAFDSLPLAARLAWHWRSFNEPAVAKLSALPNGRIVIYEELCREPVEVVRALFAFLGLNWNPQTARFLDTSTHEDRSSAFYDVFRVTADIADRWRHTLPKPDQEAITSVMRESPLACYWPDLAVRQQPVAAAQNA